MRDKWTVKKLGDICESYSGGTPNRGNDTYYGGNVPWISSGEVNQASITETKEYITDKGLQFSSAKWIPKEAILVAMYGATAGQVSKLKIKATSNQAVLAVIPKDDDVSFLYYQLKGLKEKILYLAQGSGQPNLSKALIDETLINLPPLPKQRKIAKILSTCDTVIAKTEEAIAKYQAIKQGMMHDLFTRGIDLSTGKLRPKYQDAPELYKPARLAGGESELGMIPKDWEVKRLEEYILLLKSGLSRLLSQQDIGLPVLISGNIQGGKFDFGDLKYWYEKDTQGANTQDYLLDKGDILLCFINSLDQIGKSALFEGFHRPCIYTTNLFRIKASELSSGEFLFQLLNSDIVKNEIKLITKPAVNQASFTTKDFSKILVPYMNKDEQNEIVSRIKAMDLKQDSEESTLSKYHQIKSGLMQDLLSGKVEVSVSKEEVINA